MKQLFYCGIRGYQAHANLDLFRVVEHDVKQIKYTKINV